MSEVVRVFVYGTLKQEQCRGNAWPRTPVDIQPAFTLGELYDLGPYPAMTAGEDVVSGELWRFRPEDLPATLETLDVIEDVAQGLYKRIEVECWTAAEQTAERGRNTSKSTFRAYTYHYCESLDPAGRIQPQPTGFCIWPVGCDVINS